jgi:adenine-specific DNA-methyltransferase
MKVCISGSRSITKLNQEAKATPTEGIARINKIMDLKATILIGDAPGVDSLVQSYLHFEKYDNVEIWHTGEGYAHRRYRPRNNYGDWHTVKVDGTYAKRNKAMCDRADYGLAIWDGFSIGTERNINHLGTRMRTIICA